MKFAITAGHDDREPGNSGGGFREADLMLQLRHLVAVKLREFGHEVIEDGARGVNQPLSAAIRAATGVKLAVELHTNASVSHQAQGVEVVARLQHKALAQALAQAIGAVLQSPARSGKGKEAGWYDVEQHRIDRGWQQQAGFVRAGGLIVETFFQTNPRELAEYQAKHWLVASAIARVLHEEAERRKAP